MLDIDNGPDKVIPEPNAPPPADAGTGDEGEEYFTAQEIAACLGVAVEAFQALAALAGLRPVAVEGQPTYAFRDVLRFLKKSGVVEGEKQE